MLFTKPRPLFCFTYILCSLCSTDALTFNDAEHTFDTLQTWYSPIRGLWDTGWWNSANCLTMIVNYASINDRMDERTKDLWEEVYTNAPLHKNDGAVKLRRQHARDVQRRHTDVYPVNKAAVSESSPGFLNDFYDDEGWYGLAWIAVYDHTHDPKYLAESIEIFNDMHAAWNTTPVGGLWWNKQHDYVNAIANELYMSLAAHLANRVPQQDRLFYSTLAQDAWIWMYNSGMINSRNNIEDGLLVGNNPGNTVMVWSYNQGVILGGLLELAQASDQAEYRELAKVFANAALANLTDVADNSNPTMILHEPCEAWGCGDDGAQFKGIFVRNLVKLHQVVPDERYKEFLRKNADALWNDGKDEHNRLGEVWSGPFREPTGPAYQCSGMDLFVGALTVLGEWPDNGAYPPTVKETETGELEWAGRTH